MAILQLPVSSDYPKYKFKLELDGTTFTLNFRYNSRMDRWIMDVLDSDTNPLKMGIPLLLGVPFLDQFQDDDLPLGSLFLINPEAANQEAGEKNLGESVLMLYSEAT